MTEWSVRLDRVGYVLQTPTTERVTRRLQLWFHFSSTAVQRSTTTRRLCRDRRQAGTV